MQHRRTLSSRRRLWRRRGAHFGLTTHPKSPSSHGGRAAGIRGTCASPSTIFLGSPGSRRCRDRGMTVVFGTLSHTLHHFPSPLGEGGRRPDEGGNACFHRDLPLTLTLSQGIGKVRASKNRGNLSAPHPSHGTLPSVFGTGGTGPVTCARKLAEPVRASGMTSRCSGRACDQVQGH